MKIQFSMINLLNLMGGLICLVIIGCTFHSLHLGIPWDDEAAQILPAYKYLLGQTPFVDEYSIIQLPDILTFPLFKLFYFFNHGHIDGIFIFGRRLYTIISIGCALYLCRLISAYLPYYLAILISVNLISFVPLALHAPFYDNLAQLFLTSGFFSLFRAVDLSITQSKDPKWMFFAGGTWLGLAASIYPPLGICWLFPAIVALKHFNRQRLKYYLMGLSLGVAWLAGVIFYIGIKQFLLSLSWSHASTAFAKKGIVYIKQTAMWYLGILKRMSPFLAALLGLRLLQYQFKHTVAWQLILIAILIGLTWQIMFTFHTWFGDGMEYTIALALVAPFLFLFLHSQSLAKSLFLNVWIPSILTIPIIALVSGTGGLSTVIAAISGALVCLFFISLLFISVVTANGLKKISLACLIAMLLMIAYRYQFQNLKYAYGENAFNAEKHCLDHGPFKGLCSSQQSLQLINNLEKSLSPFSGPNKTISIFSVMEVGYFLDGLTPLMDNAYPYGLKMTIAFFQRNNHYPDIILLMKNFPPYWENQCKLPPYPEAEKLIAEKYQLAVNNKYFAIYTKKINSTH